MINLKYSTQDKSLNYKITFIKTNELHIYYVGKSYPLTTQCLIFENDLLIGYGTVVKHDKDMDNQQIGYIEATKKAIKNIPIKEIRTNIWEIVLESCKVGELSNYKRPF